MEPFHHNSHLSVNHLFHSNFSHCVKYWVSLGEIPSFVQLWFVGRIQQCLSVNEACYGLAYKGETKGQHLISIHSTVSSSSGILLPQVQEHSLIRCTLQAKHVLIENISIYTPAGTKGLREQKEAWKGREKEKKEGRAREEHTGRWKLRGSHYKGERFNVCFVELKVIVNQSKILNFKDFYCLLHYPSKVWAQ